MAGVKLNIEQKLLDYNRNNPENTKGWHSLAEETGVSYPTINNLNKKAPRQVELIFKIADALECTVDDLRE